MSFKIVANMNHEDCFDQFYSITNLDNLGQGYHYEACRFDHGENVGPCRHLEYGDLAAGPVQVEGNWPYPTPDEHWPSHNPGCRRGHRNCCRNRTTQPEGQNQFDQQFPHPTGEEENKGAYAIHRASLNTIVGADSFRYLKEDETYPSQYVRRAPSLSCQQRLKASLPDSDVECESTQPKSLPQPTQKGESSAAFAVAAAPVDANKVDDLDKWELKQIYERNMLKWRQLTREFDVDADLNALENIIARKRAEKVCADVCGDDAAKVDGDSCCEPCGVALKDFSCECNPPCADIDLCDFQTCCPEDKYGLGNNNVIIINSGGNHCEGKKQESCRKSCECETREQAPKPSQRSKSSVTHSYGPKSSTSPQPSTKSSSQKSSTPAQTEKTPESDETVEIEINIDESESIESMTMTGSYSGTLSGYGYTTAAGSGYPPKSEPGIPTESASGFPAESQKPSHTSAQASIGTKRSKASAKSEKESVKVSSPKVTTEAARKSATSEKRQMTTSIPERETTRLSVSPSPSPLRPSPKTSTNSPLEATQEIPPPRNSLPEPLIESPTRGSRASSTPIATIQHNLNNKASSLEILPRSKKSELVPLLTKQSSVKFKPSEVLKTKKKDPKKIPPSSPPSSTSLSSASKTSSSSSSTSTSSNSCSCCSCNTCARVCDRSRGCNAMSSFSRTKGCRSSRAGCTQSARDCSATKKSHKCCQPCETRNKNCNGRKDGACGNRNESRQMARKCCKRKTDPNHQCRVKGRINHALSAATSSDRNAPRFVDDKVRGRLLAVEQMLKEVKREVIDKVKRGSDDERLLRSSSMPEKFLRFEDGGSRHRRAERARNDNNNGSSGGKIGPRAEAFGKARKEGVAGGRGGDARPFKTPYEMENDDNGKDHRCRQENQPQNPERTPRSGNGGTGEREMEEEFRRLDSIKTGVAELKRRHVNQSLTLKETQEKLRRALEQLQDR